MRSRAMASSGIWCGRLSARSSTSDAGGVNLPGGVSYAEFLLPGIFVQRVVAGNGRHQNRIERLTTRKRES